LTERCGERPVRPASRAINPDTLRDRLQQEGDFEDVDIDDEDADIDGEDALEALFADDYSQNGETASTGADEAADDSRRSGGPLGMPGLR